MSNNHEQTGLCELCGIEAESEVAEVVGLDCSYKHEAQIFHQACVEKYLKSIRCERNRKSGFPCPRGCGKAPIHTEKCKGKITKSHPVTIRSEGNKKRRQAELESLQKVSPDHNAKGKSSKESSPPAAASKSEKKSAAAGASSSAAAPTAAGSRKGKPVPTKPVIIRALNVANPSLTTLPPPKTAAERQREALQAARDKLRAEIATNNKQPGSGLSSTPSSSIPGASRSSSKPVSSSPGTKQVMTLDEYMAARSASNASSAAFSANKLNDATRSSSAASSAPSAAAAGSSHQPAVNAWSRMTASLGEHPSAPVTNTTTHHHGASTVLLPSSSFPQSVDSFPGTPGRETLPSSYAPSEDYSAATAMAPVRVGSIAVVPTAASVGTGTEGNTPRGTPRGSIAETATAAGAVSTNGALVEIIPGLIDQSKLTKAQRKNLKRAEKKAAARFEETSSLVSCATDSHVSTAEHSSVAGGGGVAPGEMMFDEAVDHYEDHQPHAHLLMPPQNALVHKNQFELLHEEDVDVDAHQQTQEHVLNTNTNNYFGETPPLQPASPVNGSTSSAGGSAGAGGGSATDFGNNISRTDGGISQESVESIVQYKLSRAIAVLVELGFEYEACARTAVACGGDIHSSIQDLLVAETGAESVYPAGTETPVDISEELAIVQLLQQRYSNVLPPRTLDALIVQCLGNLDDVASHLEGEDRMFKQQQQLQQQQPQFEVSAAFVETTVTTQAPMSNGGGGGRGSHLNNDGLGGGSLFGGAFGLPDELIWSQSASQHPACDLQNGGASNEWTSLLGGSCGSGGGGSLFGTTNTVSSHSLFGTTTTTTNAAVVTDGSNGISGLGLGFSSSTSSPAHYESTNGQQQQQQYQYQQSAPQHIMPGSVSYHQQQQVSHGIGSANFSGGHNNTVLAGNGGGGGELWGSASTVTGSFGTGGSGFYGGTSHSTDSAAMNSGLATSFSYDANNHGDSGGGGYLSQAAASLNAPNAAAAGYGMNMKNGMQYSYSDPQHHQQQQQMQYPGSVGSNGAASPWPQQQQQQHQIRTSFDGNNIHSPNNAGFYAHGAHTNSPGGTGGMINGNSNSTANGTAGFPAGSNGAMMMAMMVQDQANQEQRELQSLMGNLGLYSS